MIVDEKNDKKCEQGAPAVEQGALNPLGLFGGFIMRNQTHKWRQEKCYPHYRIDDGLLLGLFVEYAHDGFFSFYIGNKGNSVRINDKIFSAIYVKVSINRPYVGAIGAALDMSGDYFAVLMPDVGHSADCFGHRVLGNRETRLERGLFTSTAYFGM